MCRCVVWICGALDFVCVQDASHLCHPLLPVQGAMPGVAMWCRLELHSSLLIWSAMALPTQKCCTRSFTVGRARCQGMGKSVHPRYGMGVCTTTGLYHTSPVQNPSHIPCPPTNLAHHQGQCTFGPRLSDEDIRNLTTYILQQAEAGWR